MAKSTKSSKAFWKSKYFWFNALSGGLTLAQALSTSDRIPPEYCALAIAAGNLIIRLFFSSTKLALK